MRAFLPWVLFTVSWCFPSLLWAGPQSQSGFAGAGALLLVNEPQVDVVTIKARVDVKGDDAVVRVVYGLRSKAGPRSVLVTFPSAVRVVERDGVREPPPPWREVSVSVDGKELPLGTQVDPVAMKDAVCGDGVPGMPVGPAWGHSVRARVELPAGSLTLVELRFTATMTHDDWRDLEGRVERSERKLCLRLRPLSGAKAQEMPAVELEVHGNNVSVSTGKKDEEGVWRFSGLVLPVGEAGDFVISAPPP